MEMDKMTENNIVSYITTQLSTEELIAAASVKRFFECCLLGVNISKLPSNFDSYNIDEVILNSDLKRNKKEVLSPIATSAYSRFRTLQTIYDEKVKQGAGEINSTFKLWRSKQIKRVENEFGPTSPLFAYYPIVFELSDGCSVGCWFCCFSASRLESTFSYSDNFGLWRDVLSISRKIIGNGSSVSFLYWATDPFDNIDYEKFCGDFYKSMGRFPLTTTALATRSLVRTRGFLKLAREYGGRTVFSILSNKQAIDIFNEFSPEELLFVDLAPQTRSSLVRRSNSGRFRKYNKENYSNGDSKTDYSTACVSGFLVNLVRKSVSLISPCSPNQIWRLGYKIHSATQFETARDYESALLRLIKSEMKSSH